MRGSRETLASPMLGVRARAAIENRLRVLEGKPIVKASAQIAPPPQTASKKWEIKEAKKYNKDADGLTGEEPAAAEAGAVSAHKRKLVAVENGGGEADEVSSSEASLVGGRKGFELIGVEGPAPSEEEKEEEGISSEG